MLFFKKKPIFILGFLSILLGILTMTGNIFAQGENITLVGDLDNKTVERFEVFLKKEKQDYVLSSKGDSILVPAEFLHSTREKILKEESLREEKFFFGRISQPSFLKANIILKQEEVAIEGILKSKFKIEKVKKFKNLARKNIYVFLFNEDSYRISHADLIKIKKVLKVVTRSNKNEMYLINTKGKLIYDSSMTIYKQSNAEIVTRLREAIELEQVLENISSTNNWSHLAFVDIDKGIEKSDFKLKAYLHVDGNAIHNDKEGFNKENIENYKNSISQEISKNFFGDFELVIKETIFSADNKSSIEEMQKKPTEPKYFVMLNTLTWLFNFCVAGTLFFLAISFIKNPFKKSDNWLFEHLDILSIKKLFAEEPEYLVASGLQGLKESDRNEIKRIVGKDMFNKVITHVGNVGEVSESLKNKVQDYIFKRYEVHSKYLKNPELANLDEISSIYQYLNPIERNAIDWYLKTNSLKLAEVSTPLKVNDFERIKSQLFRK